MGLRDEVGFRKAKRLEVADTLKTLRAPALLAPPVHDHLDTAHPRKARSRES